MTEVSENRAPADFRSVVARGLVVSCQAYPRDPLFGSLFMRKMAESAALGGAVAIRANGAEDIRAICPAVTLPVIGLIKDSYPSSPVTITPTFREAVEVARAGAAVIAVDGTPRDRPHGETLGTLIRRIHTELRLPVLADISCVEDGRYAVDVGADALATTLSGYVAGQTTGDGPDLDLVGRLARLVNVPVIAEGRYETPDQAAAAMTNGAWAVVVGKAITRPTSIAERFVAAIARPPRQ